MTPALPRRALMLAAALAAAICAQTVYAQTPNYPSQPVTLIVPYTPGGSNDVVGRLLGSKLSSYWGQTVIVDNRPGAGGNVGASYAARSAPNGYTLLITPNNLLTMNPFMHSGNGVGYDPIKDFTPISLVATGPILLAINAKLPVNSVPELIQYAKSNPSALSYASAGIGTPHHLTAELFKSMAGIEMLHVPYRGAVSAITDLAAGRVDVMFGIPNSLMPFIERGELKALGVSGQDTLDYLPGVPTIDQAALPGFNSALWIGLTTPAGTPPAIVEQLNRDVARAMQEPDVIQALEAQGLTADASTPQAFETLVREDAARWSSLIKSQNIKAE